MGEFTGLLTTRPSGTKYSVVEDARCDNVENHPCHPSSRYACGLRDVGRSIQPHCRYPARASACRALSQSAGQRDANCPGSAAGKNACCTATKSAWSSGPQSPISDHLRRCLLGLPHSGTRLVRHGCRLSACPSDQLPLSHSYLLVLAWLTRCCSAKLIEACSPSALLRQSEGLHEGRISGSS